MLNERKKVKLTSECAWLYCAEQVNIWVPQPEQQSDVIKITGQVDSVERAKQGLLERVQELKAEQEDRVQHLTYDDNLISIIYNLRLTS